MQEVKAGLLKMLTANLILSAVGVAALSEPSSNLGGITGSTETLTYLLVRGLGSAHYPEFGGSNPPVSNGEHGIRRYRLMVRTLVFETSNAGSIPANA